MTVSKRLRYEVLRRDDHTCRYCGAKAPDVPITIDHVLPVALGGTDTADNLVAACKDCNAGKAASKGDDAFVAQVSEDARRWALAVELVIDQRRALRRKYAPALDAIEEYWRDQRYGSDEYGWEDIPLPDDWRTTAYAMLERGLPIEDMQEACRIAMERLNRRWPKRLYPDAVFAYFCGVCKNTLIDIEEAAKEEYEAALAYKRQQEQRQADIDALRKGLRGITPDNQRREQEYIRAMPMGTLYAA